MKKIKVARDEEKLSMEEKNFRFEKYKYKMELVKWFVGSIALVLVTYIIDNGFKERTAGIQEMQAFDKYVEIILKAGNIEERWNLTEYFSVVTPTERLRERWVAYKDSLRPYYNQYRKLKAEEFALQSKALKVDTSGKGEAKLLEIKNQIAPYEKRLINNDQGSATVWNDMGFAFLLNRDVENSIISFKESEKMPGMSDMTSEISAYLDKNKSLLKDRNSKFWKTAYQKIVSDFSAGMPEDTRARFIESSK